MLRRRAFRPFTARGRGAVGAILVTFGLFSAISIHSTISTTQRSQHRAAVVEVAARQRTLAERYVKEVLLARAGVQADPTYTAAALIRSAKALLDGGIAPAVNGDDDETTLAPASGKVVRAQLQQEQRLVADLTATGSALFAHRPVTTIPLTAHEHVAIVDPVGRLRVLSELTANVSLNAARTIATQSDANISHLITLQVVLGIAGLLMSLLLAFALMHAARRQTAHFRSLVTSSTDLVVVFGTGGCRYVSQSVTRTLGRPEQEMLGQGFGGCVHADDRGSLQAVSEHGEPHQVVFRLLDKFGEWRHLEANVTNLKNDRRVRGVVLNARDVTERIQLEEELTHQAFHDGLTGLANRALFRDRLDQALARSERSQEVLAVLLVDLDGFKQVNDGLGHDAGDQMLQQVADRFAEVIRPGDTLARLGGDEFALLIEGANESGAVAAARRLLECLSAPVHIAGHQLALETSIGIALHPGGPGDGEGLVRHADLAMYEAKAAGRGHHEVFRHEMAREFGELLGLEHEMRQGLEQGEFSVHYQPEIDLDTHSIVGVETLARWNSPTRGAVAPVQFIPIAEATGLIIPLGELVLNEACRQTAQWCSEGLLPDTFVTWVNLSGKQLSHGGVSELVQSALEAAGLAPSLLGLEVTETAIIVEGVSGDRARAELEELHDRGVRIAIDDFGTGFSSLGHLRRFPVDVIKVDRSFVQGVEHDAKDAAITANLTSLAHALGLTAIAEGIETEGQLASVRELGCDLAQGFLFARPMPAGDMTDLLADDAGSQTREHYRASA